MLLNVSIEQQAVLMDMVENLSSQLLKQGHKIATVESCTGGSVAALFTGFAGSSTWFDRGFVTYSNLSKTQMVGVQAATLVRYGAVSEQVASEMAQGGVNHSEAACALSITGIAGPEGGTDTKPVGTVCFAWAGFGGSPRAERRLYEGDRASIRLQSVLYALQRANSLLKS